METVEGFQRVPNSTSVWCQRRKEQEEHRGSETTLMNTLVQTH